MEILAIILCGILAFLYFKVKSAEAFIRILVNSARKKNRLLVKEVPSFWYKNLGELAIIVNKLIDEIVKVDGNNFNINKLEPTLGAISEAILIIGDNNIIEYANFSAEKTLANNTKLKGMRLEQVIRVPNLLKNLTVNRVKNKQELFIEPIHLNSKGVDSWFEVSCSITPAINKSSQGILLVLYDVSKLKRLENSRKEFVSNVSHELRTPLTIIKGFSETLVEDKKSLDEKTKTRFLQKISKNADRLIILVDDLFDLARLESQPNQLDYAKHSLQKVLLEIKEIYADRLDQNKQALELSFDKDIDEFFFDLNKVFQIFNNLMENSFSHAVGFTRIMIRVNLSEDKEGVIFKYEDNGPGVDEKDLPRIFERFYMADKGRAKEKPGTGLGLSIVKHIVLLHGGRIQAKNVLAGGMEVAFNLPYLKEPVER